MRPYPPGTISRNIVALAIRSGIAPDVWRAQDPADINTAFDLLEEESRELEEDKD